MNQRDTELFKDNVMYTVEKYKSHEDWLINRGHGIGGSDAASIVNLNPFKTLRELWNEKKYGSEPFTNEAIQYGVIAEDGLRTLYKAKHPGRIVEHMEDTVLVSNEHQFMRYSPDGLIIDEEKRKGILEIKTGTSRKYTEWFEKDEDGRYTIPRVPDNYYIQTLHGLLVTGFDFVNYICELRYEDGHSIVIERDYTKEEAMDTLEWLLEQEIEVWEKYFEADIEPPIMISL